MTPDTELPRHLRTEANALRLAQLSDISESDQRRIVDALTAAADVVDELRREVKAVVSEERERNKTRYDDAIERLRVENERLEGVVDGKCGDIQAYQNQNLLDQSELAEWRAGKRTKEDAVAKMKERCLRTIAYVHEKIYQGESGKQIDEIVGRIKGDE